ncbi:hypothetical protein [Pseudomonas subflava]|uniref:hypothetical protein n=1 Tax=Pseudomonas subflava TaxID=2952933 RepID=UPI0020796109|nr:hypothetical protein [Pseudomonas subflava]
MHTVHLSLFCAAALLVNGAYATEFTGSAGAAAKTAELTVPAVQVGQAQDATSLLDLDGYAELRRQASRAAREDGRWVRISDQGDTDTAARQPRPSDSTPRWVF